MQYRLFGRTGVKVSALGFGCMRLPMQDGRVDRDRAVPLIRRGRPHTRSPIGRASPQGC